MSENISVLRFENGAPRWLRAGEAVSLDLADPACADALREQLAQRTHRVLFAAPGADIRLLDVAVTREEKRHLAAALPFMLEDTVAEDIEALHFARADMDNERVAVAAVRHTVMGDWNEALGEWAGISRWVPEPLLLPWSEGQWTLVVEGERALLRYGVCAGTALEKNLLVPLLQALATADEPAAVVVYGQLEAADRELLPAALRDRVQWRRGGLGEALLLTDDELDLNLLQGEYAPRLPYERWWRQWKAVAALLLVAVTAHLLSAWLDLRQLEAQNLALRAEIQSVYRGVNPRGAVADAEKQLRRQLAALGGTDSSGGFTVLLEPLGSLLAAQDDATLASLNYTQRSGELRVNMLAADFAAVERIRSGLADAGLSAVLENSSRSGQRVRARMRIGESPP